MVEHHAAHAASAYYPSPFDDATVLTIDRDGDFRSAARWHASGNQLHLEKDLYYPDSLGDLYSRVTELLGFTAGSDEHKVQWLSTADSGEQFLPLFEEILGSSGWPCINRAFFDSDRLSAGGFSEKFYSRLGLEDGADIPATLRAPLAAGLQHAVERVVLRMAGPSEKLCLAGGLAMNALLISALEESKQVFVQPAAGNTGTALGAVFYAWNNVLGNKQRASLNDLCLGPSYSAEEVKKVLENCKLRFRYLMTTEELLDRAVRDLNSEKIIAWMQGRMEFGPRALGNRSILASPLNPYSTENLNTFIKHREPFRKFAASVPEEMASEYFETGPNARYLATVGRVRAPYRNTFGAAVLDGDAVRVHLVRREDNPLFHRLLHAGARPTGFPCYTTPALICSAILWSARRAMRCAASIRPASTRSTWGTSSSKSKAIDARSSDPQSFDQREESLPPAARPQSRGLVSRGAGRPSKNRAPKTSPSSCRSAIPPATGATSWSANRLKTTHSPRF